MPWHFADIMTSLVFGGLSFAGLHYSYSQSLIDKAGPIVAGLFIIVCILILVGCSWNLLHNLRCLFDDIKEHIYKSC